MSDVKAKELNLSNLKSERQEYYIEAKVKAPPEAVPLDPNKQGKFSLSFLCNDITEDPLTTISMNLLSFLLHETPNSPLY